MNDFPINTGVILVPQPGVKPPYKIEFIELDDEGRGRPDGVHATII